MKQPPLLVEYLTNLSLGQKYTLLGKIYWRKLVAVFTVIWSAMITVFGAMTHPFNTIGSTFANELGQSLPATFVPLDDRRTYFCTTCRKQMPKIWDTRCSRCGATSCYDCSVTLNDKQWLCRKCAGIIEQQVEKAKELSQLGYAVTVTCGECGQEFYSLEDYAAHQEYHTQPTTQDSRPLYYSYDVSDKVSHVVQRNDR